MMMLRRPQLAWVTFRNPPRSWVGEPRHPVQCRQAACCRALSSPGAAMLAPCPSVADGSSQFQTGPSSKKPP